MKDNLLKHIRIASPCPASWEQMTGDERARFCSLCNLHVYNIAELTRAEAAGLITRTEGRICGRIYRRSDGTVITKDCPVGLRAIRRRVARAAGAAFATLVALSSAVLGQKPPKKDDPSCKQQVTISKKISDRDAGTVTGTIIDPNGALVAGARIRITEKTSKKSVAASSNDEGIFRIAALGAGVYDVVVESPGFNKLEVTKLTIASKETVNLTLILTFDSVSVTMGVIALDPMIDNGRPGTTTIFSGDVIRKLPIP